MSLNLKALTLNVWGIKYLSKDVNTRYNELIKALNKSDYDIVALQEVWSNGDFEKLKKGLKETFPFSNYFHSGLIGSGCCLFSKYSIIEVFRAQYSLNGAPYKIQHGDWFGGKSVGLARIQYFDMVICVYVTHLHANYSGEENDEYIAHRISQAFELSQFISITSESADFVLLMGDLNLLPNELGFKILRDNAFLFDTFIEAEDRSGNSTCYLESNSYLSASDKAKYPGGIRIDYILYKHSNLFRTICKKHEVCLGNIPGKKINYSDHEAVSAQFIINKIDNNSIFTRQTSVDDYTKHNNEIKMRLKNELIEAFYKIDDSLKRIYRDQLIFTLLGFISFIFIFLFNHNSVLFFIKTIFLLSFFVFCIWFIIFEKLIEKKHLQSVQDSMKFILKSRYDHNIVQLNSSKHHD